MGNIWGVDYDSSIDDSDEIRSSVGIGIDWFSVIGPINFSLSEAISKADTDITETFNSILEQLFNENFFQGINLFNFISKFFNISNAEQVLNL